MSGREQASDGRFKILFRFEVNEKVGLGHLCRCRAIAIEFAKHADVEIVLSSLQEDLVRSAFRGVVYKLISPADIFGKAFFDVAVVDVPDFSWQAQQSLSNICKIFIGIDDSGTGPFIYDVLIRPNVLNLNQPRLLEANAEMWQGKDYIILHPAYAKLGIAFKEKAEEILVCFGGSDPAGLTLQIVPILARILPEEIKMNIVLGAGFAQAEKIHNMIHNHKNIRIFQNLPNLAELFSSCDTAIVSGGTLLYEACALGIPAVVLAQEPEQHKETKLFAKKKAVLRPSNGLYVCDDAISKDIEKICFDTALRRMLSRNATQCVSRDGTQRIVKKILCKLNMC